MFAEWASEWTMNKKESKLEKNQESKVKENREF